jgi:hypothetical protein
VWVVTPAGLAHWNGTRWRSFTEPMHRPHFAIRPYASPLHRSVFFSPMWEDDDELRTDLVRMAPNGNATTLMTQYSYKAMTLAPDGDLYVGTELYGLYVLGDGVGERVESMAGADLFRIGDLWTAPDGTVWMNAAAGLFEVRSDGVVQHTEVPGLGYPLTGGERSFSDGAVIAMAFAPDESVWVISRNQLPEWEEGTGG